MIAENEREEVLAKLAHTQNEVLFQQVLELVRQHSLELGSEADASVRFLAMPEEETLENEEAEAHAI